MTKKKNCDKPISIEWDLGLNTSPTGRREFEKCRSWIGMHRRYSRNNFAPMDERESIRYIDSQHVCENVDGSVHMYTTPCINRLANVHLTPPFRPYRPTTSAGLVKRIYTSMCVCSTMKRHPLKFFSLLNHKPIPKTGFGARATPVASWPSFIVHFVTLWPNYQLFFLRPFICPFFTRIVQLLLLFLDTMNVIHMTRCTIRGYFRLNLIGCLVNFSRDE